MEGIGNVGFLNGMIRSLNEDSRAINVFLTLHLDNKRNRLSDVARQTPAYEGEGGKKILSSVKWKMN